MTTNRIDEIVQITATISAGGGPGPDFGRVMLITTDNTISIEDRVQEFDDAASVARKFPSGDVLLGAQAYFRQVPTPPPLKLGKWFRTTQISQLTGTAPDTLTALQALAATWTLSINGTTIATISLAAIASLTAMAAAIQTQIRLQTGVPALANATVFFTAATGRFQLTLSNDAVFTENPNGTLANALGWDDGAIVNGNAAETIAEGMAAIVGETQFYWLVVDDSIDSATDVLAFANWAISANKKFFIWDEDDAGALVPNEEVSLGAQLALLGTGHVAVMYSGTRDGKAIGMAAQFSTVDFNGFNTLLAIHGKRITGSRGDILTTAQTNEVDRKKLNHYQRYGTVGYVVHGWSVDGQFIDINYGLDWMVNAMETEVFNALTSSRRIPQTPAGLAVVQGAIRTVCEQGYRNGMIDGGQFSDVVTGNIRRATGNTSFDGSTVKGYYIYIGSLALQSQTDRAARVAPPISVWLKSSGAIQFARIDLLLEA